MQYNVSTNPPAIFRSDGTQQGESRDVTARRRCCHSDRLFHPDGAIVGEPVVGDLAHSEVAPAQVVGFWAFVLVLAPVLLSE